MPLFSKSGTDDFKINHTFKKMKHHLVRSTFIVTMYISCSHFENLSKTKHTLWP